MKNLKTPGSFDLKVIFNYILENKYYKAEISCSSSYFKILLKEGAFSELFDHYFFPCQGNRKRNCKKIIGTNFAGLTRNIYFDKCKSIKKAR